MHVNLKFQNSNATLNHLVRNQKSELRNSIKVSAVSQLGWNLRNRTYGTVIEIPI